MRGRRRTDHGDVTKHCNQTEGTHNSVAVVYRIVKRLNAEDYTGTYEKLGGIMYGRAESASLELEV